ncbi:unnamed protein product, partial [Cylicostephanus goldi]
MSQRENEGSNSAQPRDVDNPIYRSYKILSERIEKFSGVGDRTFEEFLEDYVDVIERFNISYSNAKSLLPMFLSGSARVKYNSIANAKTLTWDDLVTKLAKKCKNEAVLSNVRDELHGLIQGKDSVGEFARKVLAKAKVAYQGQDKALISQLAIDVFIKGLRSDIRKAMRRLPKKEDFEEVVSSAEREARIIDQERVEERESMRAINSLLVNEKIEKIQDQLNNLSIDRTRNTRPAWESTSNRNSSGNGFAGRGRSRGFRRPFPFRPANFGTRGGRGGGRGMFPSRNPFLGPRNYFPGYFPPLYPQYPAYPPPDPAVHSPRSIDPAVYPPRTTVRGRGTNALPLPSANLLFVACLFFLMMPVIAQPYQICGTSQFAQAFSLPKAISCKASPGELMIATKVQL